MRNYCVKWKSYRTIDLEERTLFLSLGSKSSASSGFRAVSKGWLSGLIMSQWHNQISNAILAMWTSLSRHLPGYIVQNKTAGEAEEYRCPPHPAPCTDTCHPLLYKNPHCRKWGVNGAEITAWLSPLCIWALCPGCQLPAASLSQRFRASSMMPTLRQLCKTVLTIRMCINLQA